MKNDKMLNAIIMTILVIGTILSVLASLGVHDEKVFLNHIVSMLNLEDASFGQRFCIFELFTLAFTLFLYLVLTRLGFKDQDESDHPQKPGTGDWWRTG